MLVAYRRDLLADRFIPCPVQWYRYIRVPLGGGNNGIVPLARARSAHELACSRYPSRVIGAYDTHVRGCRSKKNRKSARDLRSRCLRSRLATFAPRSAGSPGRSLNVSSRSAFPEFQRNVAAPSLRMSLMLRLSLFLGFLLVRACSRYIARDLYTLARLYTRRE